VNKLKNKSAVITGATSGIGWQAALDLVSEGAFVIGVGRNPQRCADAQAKIQSKIPDAHIQYLVADLSSQRQVKALSAEIIKMLEEQGFKTLDILVNDAGVYMGKKMLTEDGIETTFAVNHLAPFLLTYCLLPWLSGSKDGRVITVSSDSHYNTILIPEKAKNPALYFGLTAYKVSKLCNVLFSREFNRRNAGKSPRAFAVDPGLVNTEIGMKDTGGLAQLVWRSRKKLGVPPEEPAATIAFLASDPEVIHSSEIYWHDSKPKNPSRNSNDLELARRLWRESCKLTSIPLMDGE